MEQVHPSETARGKAGLVTMTHLDRIRACVRTPHAVAVEENLVAQVNGLCVTYLRPEDIEHDLHVAEAVKLDAPTSSLTREFAESERKRLKGE